MRAIALTLLLASVALACASPPEPPAPGDPTYPLAAPTVARAEIALHPAYYAGERFVIRTEGQGDTVQAVTLDGVALTHPSITHDPITAGGELVVTLGPSPSAWGAGAP